MKGHEPLAMSRPEALTAMEYGAFRDYLKDVVMKGL